MPGQLYDWTCSACSLEWTKRSAALIEPPDDIYASRETTVYEIGYPDHINGTYGLMDGTGAQLQRVLSDYGQDSLEGQGLSFDDVYLLAQSGTPAMMSGASYYHWVAVRGVQGSTIWIANSAPGYKGIWDNITREDWPRLGPSWNVVWLV